MRGAFFGEGGVWASPQAFLAILAISESYSGFFTLNFRTSSKGGHMPPPLPLKEPWSMTVHSYVYRIHYQSYRVHFMYVDFNMYL